MTVGNSKIKPFQWLLHFLVHPKVLSHLRLPIRSLVEGKLVDP